MRKKRLWAHRRRIRQLERQNSAFLRQAGEPSFECSNAGIDDARIGEVIAALDGIHDAQISTTRGNATQVCSDFGLGKVVRLLEGRCLRALRNRKLGRLDYDTVRKLRADYGLLENCGELVPHPKLRQLEASALNVLAEIYALQRSMEPWETRREQLRYALTIFSRDWNKARGYDPVALRKANETRKKQTAKLHSKIMEMRDRMVEYGQNPKRIVAKLAEHWHRSPSQIRRILAAHK